MSSLLQVPWAQQLVGANQVVGLFASGREQITRQHLDAVGIRPGSNYVLRGIEDYGQVEEFNHLWTEAGIRPTAPQAYYDKAEREFVAIGLQFYQEFPNMGAMVPLQREIDIPIFSWGTLLDYAYSIAVHRDYYGHV